MIMLGFLSFKKASMEFNCTFSLVFFSEPFYLQHNYVHVIYYNQQVIRGRRGRDGMAVGFTAACTISAYHH